MKTNSLLFDKLTRFATLQTAQQGLFLMAASAAGSLLNFAYHFVTGRMLGPADYAALAALISVMATVSAPMGVSQVLLSDVTARLLVSDSKGEIRQFLQRFVAALGVFAIVVMGAVALASGQLSQFMHLTSRAPVLVLALTLGPALILPALGGSLQGWQDFQGMSIAGLIGAALRLTAGAGLVWLGFGVSGALGGLLVSGLAGVGFTAFLLARRLIGVPPQPSTITLKELVQVASQVGLATLAFTVLTNADVVFARHFFPAEQAGQYSAAATLGKIVLFLPGPVATLMFPKASARHAAGISLTSMLRKSALATLGLSLAVVAIFVVWPAGVVRLLYGNEYTQAGQWLSLYGLATIGTALVNLLMFHYLAAREVRFIGLMLCFAGAQLVLLAFAPGSPLAYIAIVAGSTWGIVLVAEAWLGGLRESVSHL